jgi:L-alanine-DL-glutamate epimerase-like enolase superfamily enzyme
VRVALEPVTARLREPFVSAHGESTERELLLLRLEGEDGTLGTGEAAPFEPYDGVSVDAVRAAIEDCRGLLQESDGRERADLLRACAERAVLPQAVAAIDLALWDLAGRRAGEPVWRLLGAADETGIEVNATIAAADRAGAAAQGAAARGAGFRCLKVKVALGDDPGRVAAVRAACGAEIAIRLDANGVWSVREAVASLRALEPIGIELCEEPVHGLTRLRQVARSVSIPVAADESASLPGALDERWCAAICLKISRCGGITGTVDAARRARALGYEVYLASTLDGPLGIAAALQVAALIRPQRASGLATLALFDRPMKALSPSRGQIAPAPGPGLGDGLSSWYEMG